MLKIALQSLSYFRNYRTFIITFAIEPLFDVMMVGLLSSQFSDALLIHSIVALSIISGIQNLISTLNSLFVDDQNRGIDMEMAVNSPFSVRYWASKVLAAVIVSIGQMLITLTLVLLFTRDTSWINRAMLAIPILIIFGSIVGFTSTVVSWKSNDPYLVGNVVGILIVLLSGVIVPLDQYPKWLNLLSHTLPFSHLMQWLMTGNGNILPDVLIAIVWTGLGISTYRMKLLSIKKKSHLI
ncbi:ABC transporter permease [Leuconostoc miyukkimchii]|uniref:ABC transporter permease n=1 Tax=Leuconostoc miyukkimchii TaxID=910540 RepID=UPI001C7CE0AC|nr:ABC transporter permease [Leuconostoc miyukkimchii]